MVRENFGSGAANFFQWWEFCLVGARHIGPIRGGESLCRVCRTNGVVLEELVCVGRLEACRGAEIRF